ncbi:MAG: methyltransferase domain-containing protein [Candidatus Omnitrophota bacterium]
MKNIFDRYYKKYDVWYDRHKFAYLSELEALRKVLPENGKGLEIGVGTGRFAEPLGITLGIDPSMNMLELARERGVNVCRGLGEELPFLNSSFDYVAIIITLCFVKNLQKVLKETARVLKKGGKVILSIIDRRSLLGRFYQRKKTVFYKEAKFFSINEATKLLKAAGFISFSYYQTISKLPEKISLVEKPKKGFGKGGFVVISAKL